MSGPRTPHVGRLRPVFEGIPPDVDLVRDVSAADWIVSSLRPWDGDYARLWSFMPEGFEACARVFHPLLFGEHYSDDFQRSWREVGAEHGVELTPDVSLSEVLGVSEDDRGDVYVRPTGHLLVRSVVRLGSVHDGHASVRPTWASTQGAKGTDEEATGGTDLLGRHPEGGA
jgi:hypothetical protein